MTLPSRGGSGKGAPIKKTTGFTIHLPFLWQGHEETSKKKEFQQEASQNPVSVIHFHLQTDPEKLNWKNKVSFNFVVFYGISTLVGYLMQNRVYIDVDIDDICKETVCR